MEKQFVTFEMAKKLKELGFDDVCIGCYDINDALEIMPFGIESANYNKVFCGNYLISAPLWQQVVEWLRTEKKIFVTVECKPDIFNGSFYYVADVLNIDPTNGKDLQILDGFSIFRNYDEALKEGIEEALTLLEQ